jgi:hypothetical protein
VARAHASRFNLRTATGELVAPSVPDPGAAGERGPGCCRLSFPNPPALLSMVAPSTASRRSSDFQAEATSSKGNTPIKKYVAAALLIAAFATPALAERFYVAYDGKRCEMMSHKPPEKMNVLGVYRTSMPLSGEVRPVRQGLALQR